jgi:hypothetical protein
MTNWAVGNSGVVGPLTSIAIPLIGVSCRKTFSPHASDEDRSEGEHVFR